MYLVLCLAGVSILFFGYDASVMSQVNTNQNYLDLMGAPDAQKGNSRDAALVGGLVSVWFLGFLIGALCVGYYADKIGRLKTLQVGCVWALLGGALLCSAQNLTWMFIARVISGVGCGHLNTVVPVWTSEIADPRMRGAFVATQFTLAISGSTLVYWMEYGCVQTQSPSFAWRFPLGFQIVFLIFILCAVPFYPESPRHLAKIGRFEEARDILERCRINPNKEELDQEMIEITEAIKLENQAAAVSYWSMLFSRDALHTRRRIFLGGGIQVMQKLTGIDFIAVSPFDG